MAVTSSGPIFRRAAKVTFGDGNATGKILMQTTAAASIELGGATSGDPEIYVDETYDVVKLVNSSNNDYRFAVIERANNRTRDPGAAMGLTRPQWYVYSETSWASDQAQWVCLTHDTVYGNRDSGTNKLQDFSNASYGGGRRTAIGTAQTSNDTATTIVTVPALTTNQRLIVTAEIVGMKTDGSAGYCKKIMGAFYRDEGNVTQDGATAAIFEPSATYAADFYIDTGNHEVEVQVTGLAATTINWKVYVSWMIVSAS